MALSRNSTPRIYLLVFLLIAISHLLMMFKALWSSLFAILRTRPIRIILATGCSWLFLFVVLKHFLWRDPHSGFFEDATVYDLGYSALRRDEARTYIARYDE